MTSLAHPEATGPGLRDGPPPTVWVSRTAPGAEATADRLRGLGCAPRVAPLLRVRWTSDTPALDGVTALAFTSRHGVEGFAARCSERRLPVFCVGDGTARAARDAGFEQVTSAGGAIDDLVCLVSAAEAARAGVVLRPGAAQPAGDFVGALRRHGVEARSVAVYATRPAPLRGELLRIWRQPDALAATLIYSPRAARRLAELCPGLAPPSGEVICISEPAAEPLRAAGMTRIVIAARPTEAAMIARVAERRAAWGAAALP